MKDELQGGLKGAEANAAFHFIATKAEMNGGKATADILTVRS